LAGATAVHAYVDGSFEMAGHWVDHTAVWKESKLWHRRVSPSGKTPSEKALKRQLEKEYTTQYKLPLTPPPAWDDLSLGEVSAEVQGMVREIEDETAARHKANGTRPLGVEAILSQRREDAPRRVKRSYAPPVHGKNPKLRERFLAGYRQFLVRYRRASYELRHGVKDAVFPKGCFPPGLPFVEHDPEPRPG
jgi:hypothetical protein